MASVLLQIFPFIILSWIKVFPKLTISHKNCRTITPIHGYCLSEKYSHLKIHSVSLERCITECERNSKCSCLSYRKNTCTIHTVSQDLSYGNFIKDESCTFLENVLQPDSCYTHHCAGMSSCTCWCEKRRSNGSCAECGSRALGMHSRDIIEDKQITGSKSVLTYEPVNGRLGSRKGWVSSIASTKIYIQVSFSPTKKNLTHIASQGSPTFFCWVTKYTIEYTKDKDLGNWEIYNTNDSSPFIFQGNVDQASIVKNELPRPLIGITAIRIRAYKWSICNHIAMRIELYGC